MTYEFTLRGHVPGKKNRLIPRGRGAHGKGFANNPEVQAWINGLVLQAKSKWHDAPVTNCSVVAAFFLQTTAPTLGSDLDGKLTTLLDVLVPTSVLNDDRLKYVRHIEAIGVIGYDEDSVTVYVNSDPEDEIQVRLYQLRAA